MAPASKPDIAGRDIEVARTLASLGGPSLEQLKPSIEKDEVTKRYVKENNIHWILRRRG
jgi:hypothetical protein